MISNELAVGTVIKTHKMSDGGWGFDVVADPSTSDFLLDRTENRVEFFYTDARGEGLWNEQHQQIAGTGQFGFVGMNRRQARDAAKRYFAEDGAA